MIFAIAANRIISPRRIGAGQWSLRRLSMACTSTCKPSPNELAMHVDVQATLVECPPLLPQRALHVDVQPVEIPSIKGLHANVQSVFFAYLPVLHVDVQRPSRWRASTMHVNVHTAAARGGRRLHVDVQRHKCKRSRGLGDPSPQADKLETAQLRPRQNLGLSLFGVRK